MKERAKESQIYRETQKSYIEPRVKQREEGKELYEKKGT